MNGQTAIFQSVGHALHVSFLVMAGEPMQDAPLRKALIRMLEVIDTDPGLDQWLQQLRGEKSGSVDFSGLSSSEVRAQCAMVTSAVASKLPDPEKWVLQAKYGQMMQAGSDVSDRTRCSSRLVQELEAGLGAAITATEEALAALAECDKQEGNEAARVRLVNQADVALKRRRAVQAEYDAAVSKYGRPSGVNPVVYSEERVLAIQNLSAWFRASFPSLETMLLDCMIARAFNNHGPSRISLRDLEASFNKPKTTVARNYTKLLTHLNELETKAVLRLEPYFVQQHIVARREN